MKIWQILNKLLFYYDTLRHINTYVRTEIKTMKNAFSFISNLETVYIMKIQLELQPIYIFIYITVWRKINVALVPLSSIVWKRRCCSILLCETIHYQGPLSSLDPWFTKSALDESALLCQCSVLPVLYILQYAHDFRVVRFVVFILSFPAYSCDWFTIFFTVTSQRDNCKIKHLPLKRPWVHFASNCPTTIQIQRKYHLAVSQLLVIVSQQYFLHTMTAQLSCHVHNFVAISSSFGWEQN